MRASNNKVADGETEGPILQEARAAIKAQPTSLLPPKPDAGASA